MSMMLKVGDLIKFTKPSGDSIGVVVAEMKYSSTRSAWKTMELRGTNEVFILESEQIIQVLSAARGEV